MNEITVKGPNTLNDIYNNLFKFRSYQVTLVFDITKLYNSIKTGLAERQLQKFWFRENPETDDWKIYGVNCFQFGDRPASALMTISVKKAAQTFKEVAKDLNLSVQDVRKDSKKLLEDIYVNDGTSVGSKKGSV